MTDAAPGRVLAVLDDSNGAPAMLAILCTLAQLTHREMQLVYVESAAALAAAALPQTRALSPTTVRWAPLAPPDVELAWRAQAGRLRTLAAQASLPRAVAWSLQVTRGTLRETAWELLACTDLLMVAGAAAAPGRAVVQPQRPRVVALDDCSASGRQAVAIARQLCKALGAHLQVQGVGADAGGVPEALQADLVVMPGACLSPDTLASPLRAARLLVSASVPRQNGARSRERP